MTGAARHLAMLCDALDDDVRIATSADAVCHVCGSQHRHSPDLTQPMPKPFRRREKLDLALTADGSLVASAALIETMTFAGYTVDYEKIPDSRWCLVHATALIDIESRFRRSVGEVCWACGQHTADLLRWPIMVQPPPAGAGFARSAQVFGEGADRGPVWLISPDVHELLTVRFGVPVLSEPVPIITA